jgi:uncharacterized protein
MDGKRLSRILGVVFLSGTLLPAGWGIFLFRKTKAFLSEAVRIESVVAENVNRTDKDGRSMFSPVFVFETPDGKVHRVTASWSSSPVRYKEGEKVSLRIKLQEPEEIKVDTLLSLWGWTAAFAAMGAVLLVLGLLGALILPPLLGPRDVSTPSEAGVSVESTPAGRTWSSLLHLSALCLLVGVPFGHLLGPLVIWLAKKESLPEVVVQGREALNFQISMTVYMLVALLLLFVLIGFLLVPSLLVFQISMTIRAAVRASRGQPAGYPLSITFIQ